MSNAGRGRNSRAPWGKGALGELAFYGMKPKAKNNWAWQPPSQTTVKFKPARDSRGRFRKRHTDI